MEDWHSFGKSYVMTLRAWLDLVKDWEVGSLGSGPACEVFNFFATFGIDHVFMFSNVFLILQSFQKRWLRKKSDFY